MMTGLERRDVAQRFILALKQSPMLFKRWAHTDKADFTAVGEMIRHELGLTAAPDRDDLLAMADDAEIAIRQRVANLQAEETGPNAVGMFVVMQQSELASKAVGMFAIMQQSELAPQAVGMFVASVQESQEKSSKIA